MTDGGVALSVQYEDGDETLDAERLLLSIGRKPNTRGLGLQQAGVALAPNGGIRVDERMRTTRPGIYAAGDVTGRDQFVYMAAYGAKIAAANALKGDSQVSDNAAMPSVVFKIGKGSGRERGWQ